MSETIKLYTDPETGLLEAVEASERYEKLARALMRGHVDAVRTGDGLAGRGCLAAFLRAPAASFVEGPEDLKKFGAPVQMTVGGAL